jgi:signal transduction histidine kinase
VRRRLALLVAATTSVVLLAFLVPLAVLVGRAAASDAVNDATSRTQPVVSAVAADASDSDVASIVDGLSDSGLQVRVLDPTRVPKRTTVTRDADGNAVIRQPVFVGGGEKLVHTVVPHDKLTAGVMKARGVLLLLGVVLVLLSLLVADRLARSMTAPISDLARTAERLGRGDLAARATPGGPDEIREVGLAVNRLATRIGELLAHERESVADLSHRLRTPATALRLDADALPQGPDRERLVGDVDELDRQVDALIREARRPEREGVGARCDARAVAEDRVEFWRPLAEDQERTVTVDLAPGPCPVRAAQSDLEAAMDALIGNVLSHTPDGTGLTVHLSAAPDGGAVLVVADEGPGFPDPSVLHRGRSGAGSTGLGLDIARRTAEASGGSLDLGRARGGGGQVTLHLGRPV